MSEFIEVAGSYGGWYRPSEKRGRLSCWLFGHKFRGLNIKNDVHGDWWICLNCWVQVHGRNSPHDNWWPVMRLFRRQR